MSPSFPGLAKKREVKFSEKNETQIFTSSNILDCPTQQLRGFRPVTRSISNRSKESNAKIRESKSNGNTPIN